MQHTNPKSINLIVEVQTMVEKLNMVVGFVVGHKYDAWWPSGFCGERTQICPLIAKIRVIILGTIDIFSNVFLIV
jgi:hypothetical protein